MLFILNFSKPKSPTVYIVADNLNHAYTKYKNSELQRTLKEFGEISQINDRESDMELIIHKKESLRNPRVFGIRLSKDPTTKDEVGVLYIADDINQIISSHPDGELNGIWEYSDKDDYVLI